MARRVFTVAALVAVAALTGACTQAVDGLARAERPDVSKVSGLEITTGESGPKPGVPDADLRVENGDGGEMDRLAINTLADVEEYWGEQLPKNFDGKKFEPVKRLVSYDSNGAGVEICRTNTKGVANAFYCSLDDSIAWDRGELLPMLDDAFGPMAVVTVLAHEMGHAVQYKLGEAGGVTQATPSIIKEQQADCYAGNFFRWVAEGKSEHFRISTGPGLNQVLATMFFIRDAAGTSAEKQGAHGSAFDRVAAFQFGFAGDPKRCAEIDEQEIKGRITQQKFDSQDVDTGQGKGNLKVDDRRYLDLLEESLRSAYNQSGATPPTFEQGGASCPDAKETSPAAYCPATNTISIDLPDLVKIGTPPKRGQKGGIGDFAAFAEIASRFSLSIQKATGYGLEGPAAGLRTACLTGAWAGTTTEASDKPKLKLSSGDLDEAVAELLADKSLIAADVNGTVVPSGFARVEAFRDGFYEGSGLCTRKYGA
ncbi:putative metalloprotease [Saccharothrix tamanrassetensis]|uniref:Putative metalloprotease n=1 Tax=Saccharothrix tamanrassetensis TaxID=1051531 RepID=A0A841CD98_9PSEU|nr:neutral zinc metallopeptidase [Saccharothrix tamanrassetensis]MBB5955349.1 putative metalloprotease [Saccharothrix tamanrassetensis]